jgi:hypothetical protein
MTDTSGTEIVRAPLQTQMQWAGAVAEAGDLIPKAFRDRAKVLVAIQYGAMLDVNPIVAMNEIYVIEGTPTMSAHLMAATVRRAGHTVRVRTKGTWEGDDFEATVTIIRKDDPEPFTATWTKARAQRANLLGKNNWKNYPEAMCKARATTECCRDAASEALMGIKYSPEELDAAVNEQGDPIDLTATAIDRTPRAAASEPVVDEQTGEIHDSPVVEPRFDPVVWEDRIADALGNLDDLRALHKRARDERVIDQKLSNGQPLGTVIEGLAARLKEQTEQGNES